MDDVLEFDFDLAQLELIALEEWEFVVRVEDSPELVVKIQFMIGLEDYLVIGVSEDVEDWLILLLVIWLVEVEQPTLLAEGYL